MFGLTDSELMALVREVTHSIGLREVDDVKNPSLKPGCASIKPGVVYCVTAGGPDDPIFDPSSMGESTATGSTPSSTTANSPAPIPTAENCKSCILFW